METVIIKIFLAFFSVQFSSVTQLCSTLCNPMDCSTPDFPVHHQLPEPTQTHVHRVSDAIQSSHPLSSPSPPTFSLSQNQGLFRWVSFQSFPGSGSFQMSQFFASGGQSIGVSASTSVLPMNIQGWYPLGWTGWISLQSKRLSRVFSNTAVQKHQFSGSSPCTSPKHGYDLERWYGVGGGRGVQDWELMYTCGGFMSMYGKINTVL